MLWKSNLEHIYNANFGNVGIGTMNPIYNLDLNGNFRVSGFSYFENPITLGLGSVSNTQLYIRTGNSYGIRMDNYQYGNNKMLFSDLSGGINLLEIASGSNGYFDFKGNSITSSLMRVSNSGNVGIGTINPRTLFHLKGDLSIGNENNGQTFIFHSRTNNQGDFLQITGDDALGNWMWDKGITFKRSNGFVGINTTNPILPLTVNGPINGTGIQLGLSPNVTENYHLISYNGYLQLFNGNHLSGTRLLTFRNNGNVGIGILTYNSDAKLAVDGTIKAKEVIVSLNPYDWLDWPDYVFEENYKLMPLEEVEKFVKENRHLPEIESADELKENGINLGEMQKKLLKKIEELTLYVIELKKENEKLSDEFKNIKENK